MQIIAGAAFVVDIALAVAHTLVLAEKDMDNAVHLPCTFQPEARAVDNLPGMADKVVVVVDRAVAVADNGCGGC